MNYKEVYSQETVDKIEELIAESYCLEDIIDFIDENSEANFRSYYQNYVEIGKEYSYEAVDAFIDQFGIHSLVGDNFQDSYRGQYDSKADYAESYVSECYVVDLPSFLEIDWEASFDNLDVVFSSNGYVFGTQF
jgi:hypothetical protein